MLLGGICGVCYDIAVLVGKVMDSSELVEIKCIDGRDCSELDVHGSKRKNFINLDFNNFSITEKGDLKDIVRFLFPV